MQYWRCKCGNKETHESGMTPAECDGCDKCGTTLAQHPDNHKTPTPHEYEIRYDSKTGKPKYNICKNCYNTEKIDAPPS